MAKAPGEIAKTINIEVQKCYMNASEAITKGDAVGFDSNGDLIAGTTSLTNYTGFGVALETVTASGSDRASSINVAVGNTYVFAKANGTIHAMARVKIASQTDFSENTAPALCAGSTPTTAEVDAVRNGYAKTVGRSFGKEGDGLGMSQVATTETFILRLGAD